MADLFTKIWNKNIVIFRILLFVLSVILIVIIFPREGKFTYDYKIGKPWLYDELIAPFDFAIQKSDSEIKHEKENIIKDLKPYFRFNDEAATKSLNEAIRQFNFKWKTSGNVYTKEDNLNVCINLIDTLNKRGIIQFNDILEDKPGNYAIILIKKNIAQEKELKDLFSISGALEYSKKELNKARGIDRDFLMYIIRNSLTQNVIFDAETTQNEKESLLNNVSLSRGMIQKGQNIISKGEIISPETFNILNSYKKEYSSQVGSPKRYSLILLGQIVLVTLSMLVFALFLAFFRRYVFDENKRILLNLILIYLFVLITGLVARFKPELLYLIPICSLPIIIRAFFDTRLALFVLIITLIITGALVPNSYEFVFLQMITGIITIISVVKLQNRAQFFLTSLFIFLSYSIAYASISIMQGGTLDNIKTINFAWFGANAMLTLFSYPLIFLFEKSFGFVTDVSLMELSSTNSKILRELSAKAPGTFQHSLQVANLAEEALYKIKGNALLARTGALYHDIGKLDNPMYFIENQVTGSNPHDDLSYEESAHIIIGHVLAGVQIAKKHNLPDQIVDFIRTHHGNTKTHYFYSMHLKNIPEDETIDESIFTYHGPIPFSKETAVVMMADAVEASSRSLKAYDEQSIDNLVENIINLQIEKNQFVNSDITLKDINNIKKIFRKRLMNIYHIRLVYPE